MESSNHSGKASKDTFSRRTFLGRAATTMTGLTIVPRHVLGGAGYVPPSDRSTLHSSALVRRACG